jgi:diacylglycerol kinase family enzyme
MRIAPEAEIDDGLLDVVIIRDLPIRKLILKLPLIYAGTHLSDPAAVAHRGRVIEAVAEPGVVKLELDGEPLGTLPARYEVLPGALRVFGPGG